ncbi:SH3 domain-containing protein [Lyngbya confervoides]|uniref:SH3 domain-containing protein n=1 Tax=Lyngbya confervoides BDU141951 TaxID=1574623 RepID=A0ABD4T163_9CYAN|nr:SH3 domain-containing protein [Lyngbya confervoides]MCM1982223.1 SH3 domain-containing protein [Lyngbya confervoides BDU141951]
MIRPTSRNLIPLAGLCVCCILLQACQQGSPDTETRGRSPDTTAIVNEPSGEAPSSDTPGNEPPPQREVEVRTYVAEKIDPVAAQLTSQYAGSKINVRSQPSTQSKIKHYGLKGDRVTLLQQAEGEDSYLWYYLQFEKSKAEGWVRSDFVTQADSGHSALLPRTSYRPYDFEGDPWLSSFNQAYQAAKANNAPWISDPEQVAIRLAGFSDSSDCQPDSVSTIASQDPNWVTVLVKTGDSQGEQCADDSVAASEIRADLIRTQNLWEIDWAGGRYRCRRGRGQQEFAPSLCS